MNKRFDYKSLYLAVIVICFVFALKTGLGWKRRKEMPVGFTGGPSKSKKLFKGKAPKPFWHSGHLGLWRSFWGCMDYTQIIQDHKDHLGGIDMIALVVAFVSI